MCRNYHNENYGANADRQSAEVSDQNYGKAVKGAEYTLYGLCVAYFICLCCMYKNIRVSIQVLKTASVIIMGNIRMLFVPFFEAILLLCWSAFWLLAFGHLLACGEITQPKHGSQLKKIELTDD